MPPKAPSNLRPVRNPGASAVRPPPPPKPAPRPVNPADIRKTKEYKVAARRWLSTIVALPIVMYTSWILYERVYGDKSPKRLLPQQPPKDSAPSASSSSPSS